MTDAWSDLRKRYGGTDSQPSQDDWEGLRQRYAQHPDISAPSKTQYTIAYDGNLEFATPWGRIDTGIPLPGAVNKRLAQFGSGFADWGLGARQLVASDRKSVSSLVTGKDDSEKAKLEDEALEKRKFDKRLNDDFTGKVLSFGGQIAPTFAVPGGFLGNVARGAAPLVEGAVVGGGAAAFQPTAPGESRTANVLMGTAAGAAIPAAISGLRTALRPKARDLPLVREAVNKYGIPLGPADVTNSKAVKVTRAVLEDLPGTGSIAGAQNTAKQAAYNRAVGGTFGAAEDSLTPDVVGAARDRITSELDRIWQGNDLAADSQFIKELMALRGEADKLPRADAARLHGWLDDIFSRMSPGANGQPVIPGGVANTLQSGLRRQTDSAGGFLKDNMTTLRQTLLSGFNRSVSGADADALRTSLGQYKAWKTVEPLLEKARTASQGRVIGDVPAGLMPEAVRQSYSGIAGRAQQPELVDLATIGSRYLVPRVEKTGGGARAALQNAGVGAGVVGAFSAEPTTAAAGLGGTLLTQYLLGAPWLTRWAVTDPVRRGLLGPAEIGPALRELGLLGMERAPAVAMPGLLATQPVDE